MARIVRIPGIAQPCATLRHIDKRAGRNSMALIPKIEHGIGGREVRPNHVVVGALNDRDPVAAVHTYPVGINAVASRIETGRSTAAYHNAGILEPHVIDSIPRDGVV